MRPATRSNGDVSARPGHWPPPPVRPPEAGAESPGLVRYRVVERLAHSPQDARYLAQRVDSGTLAELRVLSGDLGASPGLVRAFTEHAERVAAAARDCPGIATVHECQRVARGALLVTAERLQGPTLREVLQADGPLAVPRAVRLAIQVAEALEQAHGLGLVHGGLHPDNVVLAGPAETVSLTHFGFDRLLGAPARRARHPLGADDRVYQAPEQWAGRTTARSDVYALGALLYEMLAGVPPPVTARRRTAPRLREKRPDVSPSLERLVVQALEAPPRRRPASVSAMCTDLWTEISPYGRPQLPDRGPTWPAALAERPLLVAAIVGVTGALTAACVGLVVWLGLVGPGTSPPTPRPTAPAERIEPPRTPPGEPRAREPEDRARGGRAQAGGEPGRAVDPNAAPARVRRAPAPTDAGPVEPSATSAPRATEPTGRRGDPPTARPSPRGSDAAARDAADAPRSAPLREAGEDPGAIIDWLLGEGARQRR